MLEEDLFLGAKAGLGATVPMTLTMLLIQRKLPRHQQFRLPPEQIVDRLSSRVGIKKGRDKEKITFLTVLAHFGYGAAAGAFYNAVFKKIDPLPPILRGILFALFLWAISYLGWLPAVGFMAPATRHPKGRNIMMIVSHIVWGAVLGWWTGKSNKTSVS